MFSCRQEEAEAEEAGEDDEEEEEAEEEEERDKVFPMIVTPHRSRQLADQGAPHKQK